MKVASSLSYSVDIHVVGVFKGVHTLDRYYFIWETISCVEKCCFLRGSVSEFR